MTDPHAGTDGPSPSWDRQGQLGVDGEDAPTPKPKRGRPKCSEEPCGAISVWLPVTAQDRIIKLATQRRQSVSEYLRDVLLTLFVRK